MQHDVDVGEGTASYWDTLCEGVRTPTLCVYELVNASHKHAASSRGRAPSQRGGSGGVCAVLRKAMRERLSRDVTLEERWARPGKDVEVVP